MRKIHKVIFFAFESHKPCFKTGDCYKVASYIYMNMYILLTYESITSNVIKDSRLCLVGIMRHLCSATQNLFINMNVYINDETYFQLRSFYASNNSLCSSLVQSYTYIV